MCWSDGGVTNSFFFDSCFFMFLFFLSFQVIQKLEKIRVPKKKNGKKN